MAEIRVSTDEAAILRAVADQRVRYRWRVGRFSDRYTIGEENVTVAARPLARRGLIWHPPGSDRPELSPVAAAWVAAHPRPPADSSDGSDGSDVPSFPDGTFGDDTLYWDDVVRSWG